jgi:hypothetical protein
MNVESVVRELAAYSKQVQEIQEQSRQAKVQLDDLVSNTLAKYVQIRRLLDSDTPAWPWSSAEIQWDIVAWEDDGLWVSCTWDYGCCGEWNEEHVEFPAELLYKPNAMQEYAENIRMEIEHKKQQEIEKQKQKLIDESQVRKEQFFRTADEMGYTLVPKNE